MLGMRIVADIDVLGDASVQRRVARLSLALLAACAVAVLALALASGGAEPGCRVTFGAEGGFLYACANGAVLPRGRMVAVLLAPAVLVTTAIALLVCLAGRPLMGMVLGGLHLASCAGDVLMVVEIAREPACTHVRDTDRGIEMLEDAE